ncbi:MAG: polymer-forming cytoskeletal protein [Filimonas sp.]|nr:polymer-forming cytoskeletal protein [Filimonas sp.]
MFSSKVKEEEIPQKSSKTSMIGKGMIITGQINSESDVRIDGKLIGDVSCKSKIVIGQDGEVEGNIFANNADITGSVKGNIVIKELLNLRDKASVNGDIDASKMFMEPTVTFNGHCSMKGNSKNNGVQVVEMAPVEKNERKTAEQ